MLAAATASCPWLTACRAACRTAAPRLHRCWSSGRHNGQAGSGPGYRLSARCLEQGQLQRHLLRGLRELSHELQQGVGQRQSALAWAVVAVMHGCNALLPGRVGSMHIASTGSHIKAQEQAALSNQAAPRCTNLLAALPPPLCHPELQLCHRQQVLVTPLGCGCRGLAVRGHPRRDQCGQGRRRLRTLLLLRLLQLCTLLRLLLLLCRLLLLLRALFRLLQRLLWYTSLLRLHRLLRPTLLLLLSCRFLQLLRCWLFLHLRWGCRGLLLPGLSRAGTGGYGGGGSGGGGPFRPPCRLLDVVTLPLHAETGGRGRGGSLERVEVCGAARMLARHSSPPSAFSKAATILGRCGAARGATGSLQEPAPSSGVAARPEQRNNQL